MKRGSTIGTRQFAMGTRQLQTFCEVIEQRSFSRAAARLGITQPAVTLRVRALEKRLGAKLIDRSGRRVEPTDAGRRLYRGAQHLLELEEAIVNDLAKQASGDLVGSFEIGASSGPGGVVVPELLCGFSKLHPGLRIALSVFDTQMVIERVADRTLELGIVGAAPRHRAVEYEPFFRDPVILACPPGHRFAGRLVTLDELRREKLILMQDGAGIRQMIEDELRELGFRLRDFDAGLELGLQESVTTAVRSGIGVSFISRSAVERELAAGTLAEAHVAELELEREIFLIRASGRSESAASRAFVEYGRAMLAPSGESHVLTLSESERIVLMKETPARSETDLEVTSETV
jgi:DNA-binding transcriptional LysR family regulator